MISRSKVLSLESFVVYDLYEQLIRCFAENLKHRINQLRDKALRVSYCDYSPDFEELLQEDDTFTEHLRA